MQKRVLVIDDEGKIRHLYDKLFKAVGRHVFKIIEAANAEDATEILIRGGIDLVLLDINMPGINGQVMYEVIKEYNPHAKVIIASVYPVVKQRFMVPDAFDYYDKSQGLLHLLEKVSNALLVSEGESEDETHASSSDDYRGHEPNVNNS